jgi:hypothetical protein
MSLERILISKPLIVFQNNVTIAGFNLVCPMIVYLLLRATEQRQLVYYVVRKCFSILFIVSSPFPHHAV